MFLHALATAVPPGSLTQPECWDLIERSPVRQRLQKRSRLILHSVLRGNHGVDRRHFAVKQLDRIFDLTADELNAAFRVEAPRLAEQALLRAMRQANIDAAQIDALFFCTCSGYPLGNYVRPCWLTRVAWLIYSILPRNNRLYFYSNGQHGMDSLISTQATAPWSL
jgi:predicted naringenin-chalcone synthase